MKEPIDGISLFTTGAGARVAFVYRGKYFKSYGVSERRAQAIAMTAHLLIRDNRFTMIPRLSHCIGWTINKIEN